MSNKNKNVIEKDGQKYLRVGDKAIPFDDYDKNGRPIIKPKVVKKKNSDGGEDVTIKVPALTIRGKNEKKND